MISYEYVDEIDSTNDELKRRASENKCHEYQVLSAGTQTGGRGRSGHTWASPAGSSVSTSMILFPESVNIERIFRITPIAAVAVAETVEKLYGLPVQIKWPNDILIGEKKVCGILNELITGDAGVAAHVVVGIGVNVHIREFPPEISDIATSLDIELEKANSPMITRCGKIVGSIWEHFVGHYEIFLQTGDLNEILEFYNERLINKGRTVKVFDPIEPFSGEALFMDETGALHVMTDEGEKIVDSGEVSVRGIGGYV